MTKRHTLRADLDTELDSPNASPVTFNEWLQGRLKASGLTQRQLAQKTGVDHSTISRLVRGDRVPSLHTAASLARGLSLPDGSATLDDLTFSRSGSPAAGVEYALRSDESLSEAQVREIMEVYLAARRARSNPATAVAKASTRRAPVPIVVHVIGLRPRSRPR